MKPLTTKTFNPSKITFDKAYDKQAKDFQYKTVSFKYHGGEMPPIRIDGNFRVFKFENKNKGGVPTYSMAIKCNEESHSFFNSINATIATQIARILRYRTQDFKLVKGNKYGSTVFVKIHLKKSGKPSCLISKGKRKEVIELDD